MATLSLSLNASVPTRIQWFLKFYFQGFQAVVGVLIVQTPHLCLQDLLPTSTYQSYLFLFAYLQASCRSLHLSKHLTCVSRTRSQPQPVEIFSMLISRQVVGVFTVQTPHLCLQDLLPTSACRDTPSISKTCRLRQSIDKSPSTNDLTANMPKKMK